MALGRIKRVEDSVQFVRRNAGARVGNQYSIDKSSISAVLIDNLRLPWSQSRMASIPFISQIYKRLLQLNAVGTDPQRAIWPVRVKIYSVP